MRKRVQENTKKYKNDFFYFPLLESHGFTGNPGGPQRLKKIPLL